MRDEPGAPAYRGFPGPPPGDFGRGPGSLCPRQLAGPGVGPHGGKGRRQPDRPDPGSLAGIRHQPQYTPKRRRRVRPAFGPETRRTAESVRRLQLFDERPERPVWPTGCDDQRRRRRDPAQWRPACGRQPADRSQRGEDPDSPGRAGAARGYRRQRHRPVDRTGRRHDQLRRSRPERRRPQARFPATPVLVGKGMTLFPRIGLVLSLLCLLATPASAQSVRVKDLGRFLGWRDNALVGYGIVTGLAGSGDSPASAVTRQALSNVLGRLGSNISPDMLESRNVAAVIVTATLPPTAKVGDRIDVTATSIGDARSLVGGMLLMTPLLGADQQRYALAQGALVVGGYNFEDNGNLRQKNYPTTGVCVGGATVEAPVDADLVNADGRLT